MYYIPVTSSTETDLVRSPLRCDSTSDRVKSRDINDVLYRNPNHWFPESELPTPCHDGCSWDGNLSEPSQQLDSDVYVLLIHFTYDFTLSPKMLWHNDKIVFRLITSFINTIRLINIDRDQWQKPELYVGWNEETDPTLLPHPTTNCVNVSFTFTHSVAHSLIHLTH